jgi:signal transduction histidine kinase
MKELLALTQSLTFTNLDLLSVGITIAAIALLGFIVYISNTKSITNISFLVFCAVTMLWSFFNYISYQTTDPELMLMLWRIVIFLAFWHSFTFFNFLYVFPKERISFPVWYKYVLTPYVIVISLWTLLGKLVFSSVTISAQNGAPEPVVEKGIIVFVITACALIIASFSFLVRRIIKAKGDRKPYVLILIGALITFGLLFAFNLIMPAVFQVIRFIPLGAVTIFPFSAFTAYAIFRHKTFRVINFGSTLMAFFLCVATFVEIIFAETYGQLILRSGIFLFVLLISIQFVKNIFMLEKITEKLEDANSQLKSLDKLKSEFISLASHQLRSPLTVIKGYASTLTDGVVGEMNPKQQEITRHIYASAQGLASVVEDFLNVTKIEQGGMKYIFEPTNVKQIVEDLASDMRLVAEDKHLTFMTAIEEKECMVNADGVKLKQVFLNLIDNSIKYTKEGFIKVSLVKDENEKVITFAVADSGVGLSEETKKKLFTKFGRGEGGALNSGGSGLGLYLAQEIVKAHQGEIKATSDGTDKGTVFSVILPYTK